MVFIHYCNGCEFCVQSAGSETYVRHCDCSKCERMIALTYDQVGMAATETDDTASESEA